MSYILDALRRSDQQRQRGMTPTLHAAPATVVGVKQPASLFYVLLAATLLVGGMAIGWLRPWQAPQAATQSSPIAARPLTPELGQTPSVAQPPLPIKVSNQVVEKPSPRAMPQVASISAPPALMDDKPQRERMAPPKAVVTPPQEKTKPMAEQATTPASTDMPPDQSVRSFAELPASIRQEIPKISISGHVYAAEAEGRLVGINDQLMREGDSPAPGLKLEEITSDGMVFSYKKYRFRRDAQ